MKNTIRFDNEYVYKMVTVFFGVLYWLYLLMPAVDRLFDLISAVNLAFIVTLFWKRKTTGFTWTFPLAVLLSGILTFVFNGMPKVTLIAAGYALIETALMTHCDPRKSEQDLYRELAVFARMLIFLAVPIILLSLYTRYARYPGEHAFPEYRGYHEVYYYLDVTTTKLHLGRDLSSGALIGILSNANIAADFYVICLAMLLFLLPGSRYQAVIDGLLVLDLWLLYMTLSRGGYIGAELVLASTVILKLWPAARGDRRKTAVLLLLALCLAAGTVLFMKDGGLKAAVVLGLTFLLTLGHETRTGGQKKDRIVFVFVCLAVALLLIFLDFKGRDSGINSRNTVARVQLWQAGLKAVTANAKSFFFGVGCEIRDAVARFADPNLEEGLYNNMHNVYMQTLVGYGAVGLLLFLACAGKPVLSGMWSFCRRPDEMRCLAPLIGLCAALLIINLVESDIYMKKAFEGTVFWVCCGYVYRLAAIAGQRETACAE